VGALIGAAVAAAAGTSIVSVGARAAVRQPTLYGAPLLEIQECFDHKASSPTALDAWGLVRAPAGWLGYATPPNLKRQRCDIGSLDFDPSSDRAGCLDISGVQDAQDNTVKPTSLARLASDYADTFGIKGWSSRVYSMPRSQGMPGMLVVQHDQTPPAGLTVQDDVLYLSRDRREFYELSLFPSSTNIKGCSSSERTGSTSTALAIARSFRIAFRGPHRETTPGPPLRIPVPPSRRGFSCATEPGASQNDCPPANQYGPPANYCDTHRCIANYDNGRGYVLECNDGEWSHSGGQPGACSGHGGESRNPPGPPPKY
jgi:hypothetical protein